MAPKKPSTTPTTSTASRRAVPRRAAAEKSNTTMNTSKHRVTKRQVAEPSKAASKKAASKSSTLALNKPEAKKGPSKKAAAANMAVAMNTSKKRKAEEDAPDPKPIKKATTAKDAPKKVAAKKGVSKATTKKQESNGEPAAAQKAKKTKAVVKAPEINEPPTQRLDVLVFGEGSAGELGLGSAKTAVDVKRPRLNPNLPAATVGVVQIEAGGMHVIALTADNRILTWGVNDQGALGRDTQWDGGLKDMDASEDDSDDDDDDSGMNPKESTPAEVDFSGIQLPDATRWAQVAAGDSCSFALTTDGKVYGWGTFRSNEGPFGFTQDVETATRPILIDGLKNVISIKCGANHALALDDKGAVFAWGSGQQNQLGRRVIERNKHEALKPREVGLPRGAKRTTRVIASGAYHSFAISKKGDVFSWGLNNYGETGITDAAGEDEAVIPTPQLVKALQGVQIVDIEGGGHHSLATTAEGDCLVWGRADTGQTGIPNEELAKLPEGAVMRNERGKIALLAVPTKISVIKGKAIKVAAGHEHSLVVTADGKAWSCGFSVNYQTGLGSDADVEVATMIDNTAVRDRSLNGVTTGGQFSIVTAPAKGL